ncbi:MAG: DNA repair protein RadC [Pseudomonadota bacterium]
MNNDPEKWNDAELLAELVPHLSIAVAQRLIQRFGTLRAVVDACLDATNDDIPTPATPVLATIPEIARRYFCTAIPAGTRIRSPLDTEMFLHARLTDRHYEVFCCLYLDNRHRVIRFDELFRGTIDGSSVYPREVVKEALATNAAAIIVAHNHPSGSAEPSQADAHISQRLKSALDLVDIRLLDHLIVGQAQTTSLVARGLL